MYDHRYLSARDFDVHNNDDKEDEDSSDNDEDNGVMFAADTRGHAVASRLGTTSEK